MTIAQAITWLESLRKLHGSQVEVYFDCPRCQHAFKPTHVTTEAVHVRAEATEEQVKT